MIDAILHLPAAAVLPASLTDEDSNPTLSDPKAVNADGDRLHYVRMMPEQLDEWRPHVTVLAETQYTGTGTSDRVYAQIQSNGDKMALYSSVHNLDPIEIDDGEGGTQTITPPFKFGILAESALPVPTSISARQGMEQLIRLGLDDYVDAAVDAIKDPIERKLTRNWLNRASEWERDNPQLIAMASALKLNKAETDDYFRAAALL